MQIFVAATLGALAVWLTLGDSSLGRLRAQRRFRARIRLPAILAGQLTTRAQESRDRAVRAGVPIVCDLLAVCIEAGRPPRGALRVVAEAVSEPSRGVLLDVLNQIELGVEETAAWSSLSARPGYRGVGRDIARSVRSGISLGALLRGHASEARSVVEADARARARQVAVTGVVPLVACFLPAFLLVGVVPIFGGLIGRLMGG